MISITLLTVVGAVAPLPRGLPSPGHPASHQAHAQAVKAAEREALRQALGRYDAHAAKFPDDAVAAVERCKLIAATIPNRDDDDEPDDERSAMLGPCIAALEHRHPHSAAAALYRFDRTWGDEAIALANQILADPRIRLSDLERANVYAKLARQLAATDLAGSSDHARRAVSLDPTIDLTRVLGAQLLKEQRRAEAIVTLSSRIDEPPYELLQKAKLLADAGAPDRALWMLDLAIKQPNAFLDPILYGSIFESVGWTELARAKYMESKRDRRRLLTHLFLIDVERGSQVSATASYRALRDLGWNADPLGRYRLALARRFPSVGWQGRELLGLLALLGCLVGIALTPALWIVPIHYWSLWRRLRGNVAPPPEQSTRWGFRHVWIASAVFLVVDFVGLYVFDYADCAFWLRPDERLPASQQSLAASGLWSAVALMALLGALMLRRSELNLLRLGGWSIGRTVGRTAAALGTLFGIGLVLLFLGKLVPGVVTLQAILTAIREVYGVAALVLVAVVIAPLTEELVFRSVIFDVVARYMPAFWANALQALLFAAAHLEPRRLPYLFALGFLSGRLRRGSGGLFASVTLHAANNAVAVLFLLVAAARTPPPAPSAPLPVSAQLMRCAAAVHDDEGRRASLLLTPPAVPTPIDLNNVAWKLAVEPTTPPACLREAEQAIETALLHTPDHPTFLDTRATVAYRRGRVDEAIDLERMVIDLREAAVYGTQLDRFLLAVNQRRGAITFGPGATPPITVAFAAAGGTVAAPAIVVELGDAFHDGVTVYAHVVDAHGARRGLFHATFGPDHARTYRLVSESAPIDLPDGTRFDIALVDARGCRFFAPDSMFWRLYPHDATVDKYP